MGHYLRSSALGRDPSDRIREEAVDLIFPNNGSTSNTKTRPSRYFHWTVDYYCVIWRHDLSNQDLIQCIPWFICDDDEATTQFAQVSICGWFPEQVFFRLQ